MGAQLSAEYVRCDLTLLGVLTGSIMFLADLMRSIEVPHRLGLIQASSYRGKATEPAELSINTSQLPDICGRDVLLVDDIFDTGRTLEALLRSVKRHSPRSVKSAVLLWKFERTAVDFVPDYFGFRIPDRFVVGYGLDYNDDYRHLRDVSVLEPADL